MTTTDCYESDGGLLLPYVFLIPRFKMKNWPLFGICFSYGRRKKNGHAPWWFSKLLVSCGICPFCPCFYWLRQVTELSSTSVDREVSSHVNQSHDKRQDHLMFLQGGGVDQWEPKDILPPAALALIATFQVAELPPTPVTKQHNARNHA